MGFQIPRHDKLLEAYRERNERMADLRERGLSDVEIAKRFGLTRARVGIILGAKNPRKAQTA